MPLFGAKAKVRVQIDTKALASLRALNLSAQKSSLSVGFHDDAGTYKNAPGSKDGKPVSVAEVALWHEYGNVRIPARPFFYPALRDNEKNIARLQAKAMAMLLAKKQTLLQALSTIGFAVQTYIANSLKLGDLLPLSDAYLARRKRQYPGSGDRPLIRSGLLLRSIRFKATVDGKTVAGAQVKDAPAIDPAQARDEAGADLARRSGQKAAAKRDKKAALGAFNAQPRAFAPRKPPTPKGG